MSKTGTCIHSVSRVFLCILLLLSLLFTSCGPAVKIAETENPDFTQFTEEIFSSLASSDSLTLNYTLASPEKYGVQKLPEGFSSFSYEDLSSETCVYENLLAGLEQFELSSLSFQQQILYACLKETLNLEIESGMYAAFLEPLGPTTGIQAQLPVLLAEFHLDDREDLAQFFSLLHSVPDYFHSILSLEEEKSQLGTLPSRDTLQHIARQCREFLSSDGITMLCRSFENRIQALTFLSEDEKTDALTQHEKCMSEEILPAYQTLIQGIDSLVSRAGTEGSLSSYPNGSGYYRYLVRSVTGSSRPLEELEKQMTSTLQQANETLLSYAGKNPSLFRTCQRYISDFSSGEQILAHLKDKIQQDFPDAGNYPCEVKSVDESLENFLSPAFYLTPPIDKPEDNVIYINHASKYDPSSLFNTLAHEGYPGHLYQTCYMYQKKLPVLRYLLDYGGYTEGWATYAEIYSYRYTGINDDEAAILQNNMIQSLCLYGLCDIGVHEHGWDVDKLREFLEQYGGFGSDTAQKIYEAVTDEPASYLKYTVGYLEIIQLKEQLKALLAEQYSEKLFHTFILDMGPCSFSVLSENMETWCRQNGCIS